MAGEVWERIREARESAEKGLFLINQKLTELPAEIGQLTQLQGIGLIHNLLTELPAQIGQLVRLNSLDLSFNLLTKLPPEIGQLKELKFLGLGNNQLRTVPTQIAQLTHLQHLSLSHNRLTEVPQEIAQLSELQYLSLRNNQIAEIPQDIGRLTRLETLSLSNNQLKELPEEISQLSRLRKLYLTNNQLTELPPLALFRHLDEFELDGNPIADQTPHISRSLEFPPEYQEAGTAILSYFATVLRRKYVDTQAKFTIERDGLQVIMRIQTPDGKDLEQIEKTLDDYGAVVQGLMPIEEFLPDRLEAMEMRNQLRIAQVQLEMKNELLAAKNETITEMKAQIKDLYSLVGKLTQREPAQVTVISGQAGAVGQNPNSNHNTFGQVGPRDPDSTKTD